MIHEYFDKEFEKSAKETIKMMKNPEKYMENKKKAAIKAAKKQVMSEFKYLLSILKIMDKYYQESYNANLFQVKKIEGGVMGRDATSNHYFKSIIKNGEPAIRFCMSADVLARRKEQTEETVVWDIELTKDKRFKAINPEKVKVKEVEEICDRVNNWIISTQLKDEENPKKR